MIKTNEFLLISKASTAPLQMLIKFRDCKNELRERQPYGSSLPRAAAEKGGVMRLREILTDSLLTNLIRATTDHPGYSKSTPRIVNVTFKANFALFCWVCFTHVQGGRSSQPSRALRSQKITPSCAPSVNPFTPLKLKWMEANSKHCYFYGPLQQQPGREMINCSYPPCGEMFCSSVLIPMTSFIDHVIFYWAVRERASHLNTCSPREHWPRKEGSSGDTEDEVHFTAHCPKCETARQAAVHHMLQISLRSVAPNNQCTDARCDAIVYNTLVIKLSLAYSSRSADLRRHRLTSADGSLIPFYISISI